MVCVVAGRCYYQKIHDVPLILVLPQCAKPKKVNEISSYWIFPIRYFYPYDFGFLATISVNGIATKKFLFSHKLWFIPKVLGEKKFRKICRTGF